LQVGCDFDKWSSNYDATAQRRVGWPGRFGAQRKGDFMTDSQLIRERSELDEKIAAFLSQGGEIQEIPVGQLAVKVERKSQWAKSDGKKPAP
jgi:hypothetical protein